MTTTASGTPAVDARRAHAHSMWGAVAMSWGEHADYTDERHVRETTTLLRRARLAPGQRVLELACGAGGLGLAAAGEVGPGGEVVMSDVAVEMTAIAAERAHGLGLSMTRAVVLDLEKIDSPDAAFDAVLSRHGLQFTFNPRRAVREIVRVLRPGGRVAVSVWAERARNPWLGVVLDAVAAELGRPVPPPGLPGPFALTDRADLDAAFSSSGLTSVDVRELSIPMTAASFEEWWARTIGLAGPLTAILAGLDADAADSIWTRTEQATAGYRTASGLHFPGTALIASGRRT